MHLTKSYSAFMASPYRSIKHSTYFHSYDHFLSKYVGSNITFVEIGVLNGGSLFMWREFFGPHARIIGVDLNPNAKKWEESGFEIYIGSQSDPKFWEAFIASVGNIDVVIDDGGHTYEQQVITTECLLPHINDGGILIVEDTHTSYMDGFGPKRYSFMQYVYKRMDAINMRFSKFQASDRKQTDERRIWSIEMVESMVAFRVSHAPTKLISQLVDNNAASDQAQDYRYADDKSLERFDTLFGSILPRAITRYLRKKVAAKAVLLKRFF